MKINWKKSILGLIFCLGIFLRTYRLDYLELFGDELDAGYQSYSVMKSGRDYRGNLLPSYMESFSESRAPLLMYTMVPFIKIFGLNEWGVRLTAAFWGVLGIFGFYHLLKLLKVKDRLRVLTVGFLLLNPWHLQYSRSGFELSLMSFLIIWGLYFLIKAFVESKNKNFIWSAIFLCLSFYAYNTANVLVPLLLLSVFLIWGRKKNMLWEKRKSIFFFFLTMFVLSLPLLKEIVFGQGASRFKLLSVWNDETIISEINEYRTLFSNSFWSRIFYNRWVYTAKKILKNYAGAFSYSFLFGRGDVTFRHSLQKVGNLYFAQLPLFFLSAWFCLRKKKIEKSVLFMFAFLLIAPIASCLTVDGANHASRLFMMVYPLSYFSALGVNWFFAKNRKVILFLMLSFLLFEFFNFQIYYWKSYQRESWRWWHYGYKEIMLSLAKIRGDKRVLIENTYEPSLIRYLFWNKVEPKKVFSLVDKMVDDVDGFEGFCLDEKTCFVNFADDFGAEKMKEGVIYMISQDKNVGGDWDWSKTSPAGVNVLGLVYDTWQRPIFYLVEKTL